MHWTKLKSNDVKRVLNEIYRDYEKQEQYKNNVNLERSRLNENLIKRDKEEVINKLNADKEKTPLRRKDAVVVMSAVITLPKEVKREDKNKFFKLCIDFNNNKLGENNLLYAVEHNDETTPHLHIGYEPLKDEKWQCKNIMNRDFLKSYHKELQEFFDKNFNYKITIENEIKKEHKDFETFKKENEEQREWEKQFIQNINDKEKDWEEEWLKDNMTMEK